MTCGGWLYSVPARTRTSGDPFLMDLAVDPPAVVGFEDLPEVIDDLLIVELGRRLPRLSSCIASFRHGQCGCRIEGALDRGPPGVRAGSLSRSANDLVDAATAVELANRMERVDGQLASP